MKILKHGKYRGATRTRSNLIGICEACGCKFKTFADVYNNYPEKGMFMIKGDPDCPDFKIGVNWVDYCPEEQPSLITHKQRVIENIDYSMPCPECKSIVTLKLELVQEMEIEWQMSSAEHVIENLLSGMSEGRDPREILQEKHNVENLKDANMTADTAIEIACLVVDLYDGRYPPCFTDR